MRCPEGSDFYRMLVIIEKALGLFARIDIIIRYKPMWLVAIEDQFSEHIATASFS